MSYDIVLHVLILIDVLLNLFFHLANLMNSGPGDVLSTIEHRFIAFESQLGRVDHNTRILYETSQRSFTDCSESTHSASSTGTKKKT